MKLRRHIAFVAVLVASAVMFVHAVVPHHHRASDLAVCTEAPQEVCYHALQGGVTAFNADCTCNCAGVKCAAPLPFTLRYSEAGDNHQFSSEGLLPLFVCDHCTGHCSLSAVADLFERGRATSYFIADARLISQWEPVSVPGRAPPVL